MTVILGLGFLLLRTIRKIKSEILRARYVGSSTIAEYLRKQGAQIGENCDIAISSLGSEPYLVKIGNHVFISEGVAFHTHDGGVWVFREEDPSIRVFGTIIIEDNCLIGRNVTLLPNTKIGRNSIVGAGSVVINDIPPDSIVMGVPARVISSMPKYRERCLAAWKEQKPPDLNIEPGGNYWSSKHHKENEWKVRRYLTDLFWSQGETRNETRN